jgi:hypothetical protein
MLDWIVDLRAPWPGVTDQGRRETCLAMALTSAHEHAHGAALSAEYLHWASGHHPGGRGCLPAAGLAMATDGQPPEPQWSYRDDTDDTDASYAPGSSVVGPFTRRRADRRLTGLDQVIAELQQGRWVVVALRVTDAFAADGAGIVLPDGPGRAGHAVIAVGAATVMGDQLQPDLRDGDRLLCIRNSWGSGWGADGHKLITEVALNSTHILSLALD